jgi:hypothetical protein
MDGRSPSRRRDAMAFEIRCLSPGVVVDDDVLLQHGHEADVAIPHRTGFDDMMMLARRSASIPVGEEVRGGGPVWCVRVRAREVRRAARGLRTQRQPPPPGHRQRRDVASLLSRLL